MTQISGSRLKKSDSLQKRKSKPSLTLTEALDRAPLSLFHFRAFLTAGMGFFTDAYDLFIIGIVITLLKVEWHLSATQVGLLGSSTLIATLLGAFIFGHIADRLGRKRVYGLEAAIMAIAAIASAFAPSFLWLLIFRLILGVGIGGDYPVSGVIMSEYSNKNNRGQLVSLVFSMQALGLIIGPIVALTLLSSGIHTDIVWRLMLGLGALPALAVIYLRRTLPESPRFVERMNGNGTKAAMSIEEYSNGIIKGVSRKNVVIKKGLRTFLNDKRNLMLLFGTSGSWFLLDYAYYGNTISTPLVLKSVAPHSQLLQQLSWSLLIFVIAAAPGYVLACMKIDQIGHRRLQWIGFIMMGLCFGAIGILPGVSHEILPFLFLYGASYFFTEFGPNVTTFVIPTEVFSINGRATGHGIAAGIGKLGAFIGVFLFPILTTSFGLSGTLLISSGCAFAGAILSFILPEPAGKSLEEVSEEHRFIITNKNLSLAKAPIKSTR